MPVRSLLLRLAGLLAVLFGVSLIIFTLTYLAPGDKAMAIAHARYPDAMGFAPEILEGIRQEFHLNAPFHMQFLHWLGGFVTGDFGLSYASGAPVWDIFIDNLGETATLALAALTLGLVAALVLSSLAVWHVGGWVDRLAIILASVGAAMPGFWLGLLLILFFAAQLNWLPAYGTGTAAHLVLPALTLAFWVMASQTRLLRTFMLEAYGLPFIETLRLRGVSEREIFLRHVLRHASIPALTMIGLDLAGLLEGAVIVELTFSRGGLGALLAGSVLARDFPMVVFLVMFFAVAYVTINSVIEIVQDAVDPRSRAGGAAAARKSGAQA
ncbi:ABC transporter permease [Actibacterium ureilyticum]|uniref:ABC transporter permease n=1 Tax=Actibacterium ureilyticum TaxID=1590614 RepID=UPI001FED188B|nr:ABC transporter permease [Actibacterium ureilyticum]